MYSPETKLAAVRAYLDGEGSQQDVSKKYGIWSKTQLQDWIKEYTFGKRGGIRTLDDLGVYAGAGDRHEIFPDRHFHISIAVGLAAGCIPVVGYNIGAGRKDRAKVLFLRLLAAEAVVGGIALLIVELFPTRLIGIFGAANESVYYTEYGVRCFRIYLCMTVLATVNKGTFIYLQSLGKAFASTTISMVREVVFGVGFALLLPRFFGLNGVLYSMPASDLLAFAICGAVIVYTCRTLDGNAASRHFGRLPEPERGLL